MEGPICCDCGCPERLGTTVCIDRSSPWEDMDRIFYGTLCEDSIDFRAAGQKPRGRNIL